MKHLLAKNMIICLLACTLLTETRSFQAVIPTRSRINDLAQHTRSQQRHVSMRGGGKGGDKKVKYTKSNLPSKVCVVCGRPFEWRKKWEKVWDEVKYCSDRCRSNRSSAKASEETQRSASPGSHGNGNIVSMRDQKRIKVWDSAMKVSTLAGAFAVALTPSTSKTTSVANAAVPPPRPSTAMLSNIFSGEEWWDDEEDISRKANFRRLDETSDSLFYTRPRFVEHIDSTAVTALSSFHGEELKTLAKQMYGDDTPSRDLAILDLCSSWVSHLPTKSFPMSSVPPIPYKEESKKCTGQEQYGQACSRRIVGLGMNEEELLRNTQLSSFLVQDLNTIPTLPFPDESFDAVLLQLSVDYLTKPIDVMTQVSRVLRPGGGVFVTFSNRVFIEKAIAGWTGKSDEDHIVTVGSYLHHAKAFQDPPTAMNVLTATKTLRPDDLSTDPLYAVRAYKKDTLKSG